MLEPDELKALVLSRFPDAQVKVTDLTGTKNHYELQVVSAAFEGVAPIKQHRMIYELMGDRMHGEIHALALKTSAPNSS